MSWIYRLHEWCAERIPWVQFPAPLKAVKRSDVPIMGRFVLLMFGAAAIFAGMAGLGFAALMVWAIVSQ